MSFTLPDVLASLRAPTPHISFQHGLVVLAQERDCPDLTKALTSRDLQGAARILEGMTGIRSEWPSDGEQKIHPSMQVVRATSETDSLYQNLDLSHIYPDSLVSFSSLAGGFPDIVHGGLLGDIAHGLALVRGGVTLLPPFSIEARISGKVEPGMIYRDMTTRTDDEIKVQLQSLQETGKDLVVIKLKQLAKTRNDEVVDPQITRITDHRDAPSIRCIPSCVAFGTTNRHGLGLKLFYSKPEEGPADLLWARLNPQRSISLGAQLMMTDELGWWMGAVASQRPGVTVKYEYTLFDMPQPGYSLVAVMGRPEKVAKLTTLSAQVMTYDHRRIAEAKVTFMPDMRAAQIGMGGTSLDEFIQERRVLFQ